MPSVAAPCWGSYLLDVSLSEGQLGGDVEHDLSLSEHGEDRLGPRLAVSHVQASAEPARRWRDKDRAESSSFLWRHKAQSKSKGFGIFLKKPSFILTLILFIFDLNVSCNDCALNFVLFSMRYFLQQNRASPQSFFRADRLSCTLELSGRYPLKSFRVMLSPSTARNSLNAGVSSLLPNSSSSDV